MKRFISIFLMYTPSAMHALHVSLAKQIAPLARLTVRALSTAPSQEMTEHFKKLQDQFPDKVLQRYTKDHDHRHLRPALIRDELIKYMILARNGPRPLGMFSKDVDNLWHTGLLFNKDYEQYCSYLDITGQNKSVLYHTPHAEEAICPRVCQWNEKQKFIEAYNAAFGAVPDKSIWTGLYPCKSSCDPTSKATPRISSKINLFNADPTLTGSILWLFAMAWVYGGMQDQSFTEFFAGLALGASRFCYNRIRDPSTSSSGGAGGSGSSCCSTGSSCGGGGGGCGGCD